MLNPLYQAVGPSQVFGGLSSLFSSLAAGITYLVSKDPDLVLIAIILVIVVAILVAAWNQSAGEEGGIKLGIKIPEMPKGILR